MFGNWKFLTVLALLGFLASGSAQAMTVHTGADAGGSTTNSDAEFADWLGDVSSFTLDDMTGINCVGVGPEVCTTDAGNMFTQGVGDLQATNFNGGVASGANMLLIEVGNPGSFTWTLPLGTNADAFGFFAHDVDGETVTIAFDDGSAQEFMITTGLGTEDNLFWGITGLAANISEITITANDTPGFSTWDNFVFGTTVPVPAALPLFLSGLAFFGLVARRRFRGAAA